MRRIERLINLIAALLETREPMTAEEIRERIAGYDQTSYESFRRTFERDKDALRAMGIPVEFGSGDPYGTESEGYFIPKSRYYLPELDLEPDEGAALSIAAEAILGSTEAARAGIMKLSVGVETAPLPGPRIVWGADVAAEEPLLASLYTAVLDRRAIEFGYMRQGAAVEERRELEPYGLVHRRGHWYIVGRDRVRSEVRAFRVSRIRGGIAFTSQRYEIPEEFDASLHLRGEAYEIGREDHTIAVVRFSPGMRWWPEQNLPDAPRRDVGDGSTDVDVPVANFDALASWVIGFGADAKILAPPEARAALLDHLAPFVERSDV
jgi:predicted DNA-binding transcriptional regulator YafY